MTPPSKQALLLCANMIAGSTVNAAANSSTPQLCQDEEAHLRHSFALAAASRAKGFAPFGALLVCEGKVFLEGENEVSATTSPLRHAEMVVLEKYVKYKQASPDERRKIAPSFAGELPALELCQMYASTHPCKMCEGAIYTMQVGRNLQGKPQVIYGISKDDLSELVRGQRQHERTVSFSGPHLVEEGKLPHAGFWGR